MHAIIMAGGEGQRLRPLTCAAPKPLIPLLGQPVMAYTLALAARHGATDAHVTLGYMPDAIRETFGAGAMGMRMHYHVERERLGTAGGVCAAAKGIDGTFIVLSGDALTDCDLSGALAFHREKGAMATLVLKKCEAPLEYGVVVTDRDGRVKQFIEKPGWDEVVSDWVNTGIYILEPDVLPLIPQSRAYDFGKELFPFMVSQGMRVYGYEMQGYWCDVGDVPAYVGACADLLDGRVQAEKGVERDSAGNFIAPDAQISAHAQLIAPCYVGPGARVASGAVLGPHALIEAGAQIGHGARVKRSVVMADARVGAQASVSGAVLGRGAQALAQSALREGCVLGDGAVLEKAAELQHGARIWPQKRIESGGCIREDVQWGSCRRAHMEDDTLRVENPQEAMQGAAMWAGICGAGRVALMHTGAEGAKPLMLCVAAQLNALGVQCLILGSGNAPMLRMNAHLLHAQAAILCKKNALRLMDGRQCPPDRAKQRAMETQRGNALPARTSAGSKTLSGAGEYYLGRLAAAGDVQALYTMQPHAVLVCARKKQERIARALLSRLGLENIRVCTGKSTTVRSYETGFFLTPDGQGMTMADAMGAFSDAQMEMLRVMALLDAGEREIVLGPGAPQAAYALLSPLGAKAKRVSSGFGALESALRAHETQWYAHTDGLYAFVRMLSFLVHARSMPRALLERDGMAAISERDVSCDRTRVARVLRALCGELHGQWEDGALRWQEEEKALTLYAPPGGTRIRVIAQGSDMEAAQELCAKAARSARMQAERECMAQRQADEKE